MSPAGSKTAGLTSCTADRGSLTWAATQAGALSGISFTCQSALISVRGHIHNCTPCPVSSPRNVPGWSCRPYRSRSDGVSAAEDGSHIGGDAVGPLRCLPTIKSASTAWGTRASGRCPRTRSPHEFNLCDACHALQTSQGSQSVALPNDRGASAPWRARGMMCRRQPSVWQASAAC